MRHTLALGLALVLGLLLPATGSAAVRLTYFTSGDTQIGKYADPEANFVQQAKAEYELTAKVDLHKKPGRGWVGKGKLIWTTFEYEGETLFCEDGTKPLKARLSRAGTFEVVRGSLGFGHGGRLRAARLKVDPGFPALKIEAPAGCQRAGWGEDRTRRDAFPRPGGFNAVGTSWRYLFDMLHGAECPPPSGGLWTACDRPVFKQCPGGIPDDNGDRFCLAKRYELPTIRNWRSKGGVLKKRYHRRYPTNPAQRSFFKMNASDRWKLSGTRSR
jgi:hypothetical protein